MQLFLQHAINGLSLGAIYALVALGFALVFSVLRMIHFAHGDTYLFPVFVTLAMMDGKMPPALAIPLGILLGAALGAAVERLVYRPLRHAHPMMPILAAIVAAVVIREVIRLIYGNRTLPFPKAFASAHELFGLTISGTQLLTLTIVSTLLVGFSLFLKRSRWGQALLLVRQDIEVAGLMGIPVNRVVSLVYAVAGGLGVVAGLLLATTFGAVDIQMGLQGTIIGFVAAIIGGLGGLSGAVLGGFIMGLVEVMVSAYISSAYNPLITFSILIVVLLIRPQGILPGARAVERV